jgi:hypothetical protein
MYVRSLLERKLLTKLERKLLTKLERKLLTKRRAVDFGRLSSAICMPGRPASA